MNILDIGVNKILKATSISHYSYPYCMEGLDISELESKLFKGTLLFHF